VHQQHPDWTKQQVVRFVEQSEEKKQGGTFFLLLDKSNFKSTGEKDLEILKSEHAWVKQYAALHKLALRGISWKKDFVLGQFGLVPDHMTKWPHQKTLLRPEFAPDLHMEKICIGQLQRKDSVIRRWTNKPPLQCKESIQCSSTSFAHPYQKRVSCCISNALSGCPGKWKDSAFLDAALHVLLENHPEKKRIVIWSAQDDPTVQDLTKIWEFNQLQDCAGTPSKKIMYLFIPLFDRDHWSAAFVDMRPGNEYIYYLDSDLPYTKIQDRNMSTVESVFPYNIRIISCLKQQDGFNCGTYVCYWAYCMFFDRTRLLQLNAKQIDEYGQMLRRQLLLYFLHVPELSDNPTQLIVSHK